MHRQILQVQPFSQAYFMITMGFTCKQDGVKKGEGSNIYPTFKLTSYPSTVLWFAQRTCEALHIGDKGFFFKFLNSKMDKLHNYINSSTPASLLQPRSSAYDARMLRCTQHTQWVCVTDGIPQYQKIQSFVMNCK